MKKTYQNPELEIKSFETKDIITFSVIDQGSGDELDYGAV